VPAPQAGPTATNTPAEAQQGQAQVTFEPGPRLFRVKLTVAGKSLQGSVSTSQLDAFPGEDDESRRAALTALMAQVKKRGLVSMSVEYVVVGNAIQVRKLVLP
jgi:hypothetical protein